VDEHGNSVPAGECGEIVARGRITMPGYYNRPEATIDATWIDEQGRRWLRTGDIGRLDDEGFLYIVDRKKDMILSGGQNIYPGDIESVMLGHPDVAEVAVIAVPSERWGETPLAVVVPRPGAQPDAAVLTAWTNERVGRQQRISGIALRDSLPRNPNGKILKRELRTEYLSA
jgi:acyl-CoA synthetase (AMP-forming)/AMP-acid ligase II